MGDMMMNEEARREGEVVVVEVEDNDVEMMMVEEERESNTAHHELETVKWDKVLPRVVLRVLLVEADDSTRQIVAALLRKCNYKVAAVSDGLQAWEILKRKHNNIDLILTELDLPSISGYALLSLIMEHDSCKNIPVIVMSSQDSINMVLKCMLKGAADFLIKPVRKNELKNLWRHVWKKLNSGHIFQTPATRQLNVEATFENNPAAVNCSSDNVSTSRNNGDCSGKGFDAQVISEMKQTEETGLSERETNGHANNVNLEKELALATNNVRQKEIGLAPRGFQECNEANASATSEGGEDRSSTGLATEDGSSGQESHGQRACDVGHKLSEPAGQAVDLIGNINKQTYMAGKSSSNGELSRLNSTSELELTLRRVHDSVTKDVDERHLLIHSGASAFSRYSTMKKFQGFSSSPNGDVKDNQGPVDTSLWLKAFTSDRQDKPDIPVPPSAQNQAAVASPQIGILPLPAGASDGGGLASYGPPFQPIFNPTPARSPNPTFNREESPLLTSASLQSDPGTPSSNLGCSGPGETSNQSSWQLKSEHKRTESVERHSYSYSAVAGTSVSGTPCDDLATLHKSSTYGSLSEVIDANVTALTTTDASALEESLKEEGSSFFDHNVTAATMADASAVDESLKDEGSNFFVHNNVNSPTMMGASADDESLKDEGSHFFDHGQLRPNVVRHSAEREAALAKFRLKRKGRCFDKKVRYQSRKRLAEQRPRVKGQFVRQAPSDPMITDTDVDRP